MSGKHPPKVAIGDPLLTGGTITDVDGFTIEIHWEKRRGRAAPVTITLSAPDNDELTVGTIRRLPLGSVIASARDHFDEMARNDSAGHPADGDMFGGWRTHGAHRGQTLTTDDLAAVAAAYRQAWLEGRPVTQAVIEVCGGGLSKSGAAKRIMKARRAGLLDDVGPKR